MSLFDQILLGVIFGSFVLAFVFLFLVRRTRWGLAPVGLCLIVASIGLFIALASQFHVALFGEDVEGKIVKVHLERRHEYVMVRYTTPEGNEVDFRWGQGINRVTYKVNELVPVRYLPHDPTRAMIANRQSMDQALTIGTVFSLVLLIAAGFILRKRSAVPVQPRLLEATGTPQVDTTEVRIR
jgi:hypothetical protein